MSNDLACYRLGDLVTLKRGNTYKSSLLDQPGPVLLGLSSIARNGGFRNDSLRTYGGNSPDELLLFPGDIYVALKDVTQSGDLLGAVARVPPNVAQGRLTQDTVKLKLTSDTAPDEYLYWILRTPQYRSYCLERAIGTTNLSLSREDFLNLPVPVPTRDRLVLVQLLDTLEDKIAVNRRICSRHEDILRLHFVELGVDSDPLPGGGVPVSELVELNPQTPMPAVDEAVYLEMAVVPTQSARVTGWSRRQPKSGTKFRNGDTVMARITPCLENGKVAFIDFMDEAEVGVGSTEFIVLRARLDIPVHLSYFLARSPRFQAHAVQNMSGSSGRQRVGAAALAQYVVNRPDPQSLRSFGKAAEPAFAHMRALDAESGRLADLRDTLLPRLMSGEIRVREAEAIVSEAT